MMNRCSSHANPRGGFSLLELLVSVALTLAILLLLVRALGFTSTQWIRSREDARMFQAARAAFDTMTGDLTQAVLFPGYEYYNAARQSRSEVAAGTDGANQLKAFVPDVYGRLSGLHFISGPDLVSEQHTHALFFQAALDFATTGEELPASGQLNAVGYLVRHDSDAARRPPPVPDDTFQPRKRHRLYRYLQATDQLDTYRTVSGTSWFRNDLDINPPLNTHLLAENIVVLAVLPLRDGGALAAASYRYDTRTHWESATPQPAQMHQLPPVVRLLMVAIDEGSAERNPALGAEFATLFDDPDQFDTDLDEVETTLRNAGAQYRVFQTDVPIRSAKWSQ